MTTILTINNVQLSCPKGPENTPGPILWLGDLPKTPQLGAKADIESGLLLLASQLTSTKQFSSPLLNLTLKPICTQQNTKAITSPNQSADNCQEDRDGQQLRKDGPQQSPLLSGRACTPRCIWMELSPLVPVTKSTLMSWAEPGVIQSWT